MNLRIDLMNVATIGLIAFGSVWLLNRAAKKWMPAASIDG